MRAEVIAIGDELTSGQRLDTNTQWLSRQLTDLGVQVVYHTTVGDDLAANVAVFQAAIDRADVVVATGGLGPTDDDLTREALAAAMDARLVRHQASLEHIQRLFASRGRKMPERNERQADLPAGTDVIANPHGTAPGIHAQVSRADGTVCHVFALPGVPAEMQEMWLASVVPAIAASGGSTVVIRHRAIKIFGPGESQLESLLPGLVARDRQPRVGITASAATLTLRITATAADEAGCLATLDAAAQDIYSRVGRFVFGEGEDELHHVALRLLGERGATLATDEAFTRGLLAGWLAEEDPTGKAYVGGILSPAMTDVAAAAQSVQARTQATFGLAIGAAAGNQVSVALADGQQVRVESFSLAGHPAVVPPRIAKCALNLLRLELLQNG